MILIGLIIMFSLVLAKKTLKTEKILTFVNLILIGQLKSVLGVYAVSQTTIGTLLELPGLLPQVHGATLLTGLAGIAVLLVGDTEFGYMDVLRCLDEWHWGNVLC
jgi:hypothetical protein